jgi:hypothetical protein
MCRGVQHDKLGVRFYPLNSLKVQVKYPSLMCLNTASGVDRGFEPLCFFEE